MVFFKSRKLFIYCIPEFFLFLSFQSEYYFDRTGVSVNSICPGPVDTPLFHDFPNFTLDEETAKKHNSKMNPIR